MQMHCVGKMQCASMCYIQLPLRCKCLSVETVAEMRLLPPTVLRDAKGHGAIDRRYRVRYHFCAPSSTVCMFTVVRGLGSVLPGMRT
jgi:hypothetical protein